MKSVFFGLLLSIFSKCAVNISAMDAYVSPEAGIESGILTMPLNAEVELFKRTSSLYEQIGVLHKSDETIKDENQLMKEKFVAEIANLKSEIGKTWAEFSKIWSILHDSNSLRYLLNR
ncbi:MAG: hypothetical protein LBE95_02405 [Holosporaceae bacterium]|jgi:hypothetical protein|nr:hypothetical protein [Holosporaceae bacterium]